MPRRWCLALFTVAVSSPPVLAAQAPSPTAFGQSLDAFIQRGMRDWEIPGLSVAVVRNDSVLFLRGYGVRELGKAGRVDEHTLFGIMSTTKAMTAAALAMLVDDGVLTWDDPVTRWIPEFQMPDPYVTRELTIRDLLTHRAGLGNADLLWVRGDLDRDEIFHRVRDLEPAYSFRAGYTYQNIMYGVAGAVIERASGTPFGAFLSERLWKPLGMERTRASFASVHASADENVSRAHYEIQDTIRVIDDELVDAIPSAGAVWSTAADMTRWMRFLLDSARVDGRPLISSDAFTQLFRPQTTIPPDDFYPTVRLTHPHWTTYGFGWFQQDYRGHFVAFHTGSLDGRIAIIGLLPDERFGVVMLGNLDHAEFRHALMLTAFDLQLGGSARDWNAEFLHLYGGFEARADSARAQREARRVGGTQPSLPLDEYAGTYTHHVWGDLVIAVERDHLTMRMGTNPETRGPLEHWNYETFRAHLGDGRSNPTLVSFTLDANGRVVQLRLGVGGENVFRKTVD